MRNFDLDSFISQKITKRDTSFFQSDIGNHFDYLSDEIEGRAVLVIGGGGTIGSNYIKSILRFRPAKVVVVDINENGLTELVRDVRSTHNLPVPKDFITYPVNFGDRTFQKIYNHYKPFDIVANFAAHKHVRSEKDIFSIEAMIQNNLFNAQSLLELLKHDKPSHFFCVSTDKAANPVNIMGATKKLMEDLVIAYSSVLKSTTARFANVAFSNGSLLDGFMNRMMHRQPLCVPADVKRYFVSPVESGDICMLASILGCSGDIFFPKFNADKLTRFYNITDEFLYELGYTMDICSSEAEAKEKALRTGKSKSYPVHVFNSDTTGEKLYEEFYTENESIDWESYQSLAVAKTVIKENSDPELKAIGDLKKLFAGSNISKRDIVDVLNQHIPTFEHIEKGITLDLKM